MFILLCLSPYHNRLPCLFAQELMVLGRRGKEKNQACDKKNVILTTYFSPEAPCHLDSQETHIAWHGKAL